MLKKVAGVDARSCQEDHTYEEVITLCIPVDFVTQPHRAFSSRRTSAANENEQQKDRHP